MNLMNWQFLSARFVLFLPTVEAELPGLSQGVDSRGGAGLLPSAVPEDRQNID